VPGLDLRRRVGAGLWFARDLVSGAAVVVRWLGPGDDPGRLDAVPSHPHLTAPWSGVDGDGDPVLVQPWQPGGGLDRWTAAHGPATAGQVVTLGVPLARALEVLHAAGLAHGSIDPSAVLLDGRGRPALDVSGVVRPTAAGPADDVRALAGLLHGLAGPDPSPVLGERLAGIAGEDLPDAGRLATALARLAEPEPLRRPSVRAPQRPVSGRRRRRAPRRPTWAVLLLLGALAGGIAAGVGWASSSREPAPVVLTRAAAPSPAPSNDRWSAVLAGLDQRRHAAFAALDVARLAEVDQPGSAAERRDTAAIAALAAAGVRPTLPTTELLEVRMLSATDDRVVLAVVDTRGGYQLMAGGGVVVGSQPARAPAAWRVELVRTPAGWRVSDVVAAVSAAR